MSLESEFPARILYCIKQICECLRGQDILRESFVQTQLVAVTRTLLAVEMCNYIVDFDDLFTNDALISSDSATPQIIPVEYNEFDAIRRECAIDCQCTMQRQKQSHELKSYLIRDIVPIILDYSFCHIQHFSVGTPVAVKETVRWYSGTVEHIVVVNNFAFLWVRAETFGRSDGDWIPANSSRLKFFYDSQQKRIEKAQFITTKPEKPDDIIDFFDYEVGEWCKRGWFDGCHQVFAELGTFTP